MLFRSTNNKFTHFQGDVLTNVDDSSHGVHLAGGSTGGTILPCGDETNIKLSVAGKGAGGLSLGNSSQTVAFAGPVSASGAITISSGVVVQHGSTAPFLGMFRATSTAVSTPDFNTTNAMTIESSVTITGVNSSHFIIAQYQNNGIASTDMIISNARTTSTNNEVLIAFTKVSTLTVAASTATINFLVFRF